MLYACSEERPALNRSVVDISAMAFFIKAKKEITACETPKLDETVCPVCKEVFDEPKRLPCMHVLCVRCLKDIIPPNKLTLYCPIDEQELPLPMGGISALPTDARVVRLLIAAAADQGPKQPKSRAPRAHTKPDAVKKISRRSLTEDTGPSLEEQEEKIKKQVQEMAEEIRQSVTQKEKEAKRMVEEAFIKVKAGKPVNSTLLEDIVSAASKFGQTDQTQQSASAQVKRGTTVILDLTPSRKILQSLKVEGLAAIRTGRKGKMPETEAAEAPTSSQPIPLSNIGSSSSYRDAADLTLTLTVPISVKGLFNPGAVAVSKDGQIAVTDYGNECVWLFGPGGEFQYRVGEDKEGGMESPDGVAFLSDNTLVVADSPFEEAQGLQLYDSSGNFQQRLLDTPDDEDISFGRIFIDGEDRILVLCTGEENSVQVYDKEGDSVLEFGQSELTGPEKALYHKGHFFVSDTNAAENSCCIKKFDQNGTLLKSFYEDRLTLGQRDNLGIDITYPILLSLDAKGNKILAYHGMSREIKVFDLDGSLVKQIKTVSGAKDIALTSDGENVVITCGEDSIMQKSVQLIKYTV